MNTSIILDSIPLGLKTPLLSEYNSIMQNYLEHRWTAAELSGGKFCEIVYSVLEGYATGNFASQPFKPANFVDSCKRLENHSHVPRSFQILIPRMLPALYEIRNNRNVGHVGGDVDSNAMDSFAVVSISSWILGELIRVFHNISVSDAQKAVDAITQRKIPLVWDMGNVKRVLAPSISVKDQLLLLVSSSESKTQLHDLQTWLEHPNKSYVLKVPGNSISHASLNLTKLQKQ